MAHQTIMLWTDNEAWDPFYHYGLISGLVK